MSDSTSNSLSMQSPLFNNTADDRPLPEIIASGNPDPDSGWDAFPLAFHDVNGTRYYAVQDWIRGVAQTENPRNFWNMLKKRTAKLGVDLYTGCVQLPYRAADGKKYQVDHADAEGLYRITQQMGISTGLATRVLNYLAAAGAIVDGQRIEAIRQSEAFDEPIIDNPDEVLKAVISFYRRMGRTDGRIATRIQSAIQRKRFIEAFRSALRVSPSSYQFAEITDTMRLGLWKRDTRQLRQEMGLDSKANVRDYGTEIMLTYEMLAEQIAEFDLRTEQQIEYEHARKIVRDDSKFVGKQADVTSKRLGIDIPTGRPLLPVKPTSHRS